MRPRKLSRYKEGSMIKNPKPRMSVRQGLHRWKVERPQREKIVKLPLGTRHGKDAVEARRKRISLFLENQPPTPRRGRLLRGRWRSAPYKGQFRAAGGLGAHRSGIEKAHHDPPPLVRDDLGVFQTPARAKEPFALEKASIPLNPRGGDDDAAVAQESALFNFRRGWSCSPVRLGSHAFSRLSKGAAGARFRTNSPG